LEEGISAEATISAEGTILAEGIGLVKEGTDLDREVTDRTLGGSIVPMMFRV
jgi:hypothetical protein